jgi:hypothetical protein
MCLSSQQEMQNRKMIQAGLGKKTRPYYQNNQSKKDCRHGSSSRVHVLQVPSPEFKPKYHQKKSRKTKIIATIAH